MTIANGFGNATSKLASINCMGNVTSPNASFVISTATTSFPVVWQPGKFSVQSVSTLNISFVDQVTQLNYTISNVPNAPGNATVNIAALGLPPSNYVVYIIGYGSNNSASTVYGEFSARFAVQSSPSTVGINPGLYHLNLTSSISNGTSSKFIVFSSTGLGVTVNTTNPIYDNSTVNLTWTPFINSTYNATLVLISLSNPALMAQNITVPDAGHTSVSLSSFAMSLLPGYYNISVANELGFGMSNVFTISNIAPLNVTVNATSVPQNHNIDAMWTPINSIGAANVSIMRLSNGSIHPVFTNINDSGNVVSIFPMPLEPIKL